MPTYDYGHLLVVNAQSFTDCPEIQKLTGSADVKPINLIVTPDQDGQLLYEVLGLALKQVALMPTSNHFRLYRLSGSPTSTAYRTRDDFIRALTLTREDFFHLMAGTFLLETLDQIEALLHRFTHLFDRTGAELDPAEKNRLSHRALAAHAMANWLAANPAALALTPAR